MVHIMHWKLWCEQIIYVTLYVQNISACALCHTAAEHCMVHIVNTVWCSGHHPLPVVQAHKFSGAKPALVERTHCWKHMDQDARHRGKKSFCGLLYFIWSREAYCRTHLLISFLECSLHYHVPLNIHHCSTPVPDFAFSLNSTVTLVLQRKDRK